MKRIKRRVTPKHEIGPQRKGQPTAKEVYNLSRSKVIKEMSAEIPGNYDLSNVPAMLQINREYANRTGKTAETILSVTHAILRHRADAAKKAQK